MVFSFCTILCHDGQTSIHYKLVQPAIFLNMHMHISGQALVDSTSNNTPAQRHRHYRGQHIQKQVDLCVVQHNDMDRCPFT